MPFTHFWNLSSPLKLHGFASNLSYFTQIFMTFGQLLNPSYFLLSIYPSAWHRLLWDA